jgi:poly(3-hydroxybutyrate) depolymerase
VSEQTLTVNGVERRYLLSVPERATTGNTPVPLVFAFHGLTGTPTSLRGYFRVERAASEGAIVVYPAGQRVARGQRSVTRWELRADGADVAFFDTLLAHMNSTYCIDRGRVFATGHSAGAVMTNEIGCHRGDVLRAIAPVAGSGPWGRRCTGAPSVWITHGRADDPVPYREGEATRDRWLGAERCNAIPEAIEPVGCVRYTGCEGGASVVFCAHDGDHGPPAYAPSEIWSFFAAAR